MWEYFEQMKMNSSKHWALKYISKAIQEAGQIGWAVHKNILLPESSTISRHPFWMTTFERVCISLNNNGKLYFVVKYQC